jgi:hypothetical protein
VLAPIDLGPAILLHTSHDIVAAGYHRGPAGIIAAKDAFLGEEADMHRVAREFKADYVVLCPAWAQGGEGPANFAGQLSKGGSANWLEPIALGDSPLLAWRVMEAH